MSNTLNKLSESNAWKQLQDLQLSMAEFSLVEAFAKDANRAQNFSLDACGIFYDFSKNLISHDIVNALVSLAKQQNLGEKMQAIFNGEPVNHTENRAALHYLLRHNEHSQIPATLKPFAKLIQATQNTIATLSEKIIAGDIKSSSGECFSDVVHIGIGGSDLGPAMAYQALSPYQNGLKCHYVANLSCFDIKETLAKLDAKRTLFVVASKSFTTLDTLQNADTAKKWFIEQLGEQAVSQHFFAVTAKPDVAKAWGINDDFILPFWDWVGGRYSVWSAIGFSLCLGLGFENFKRLLNGAQAMDQHFFNTAFDKNLPVMQALIGIWYSNFYHRQAQAIIPYDHRLRRFPAFLQQLEMESNGKQANNQNQLIDYNTCAYLWGEPGTNSQHSFFQQLHQGPEFTPVEFIAICEKEATCPNHQDWLIANCLAQSRALMVGQTSSDEKLVNHQFMPGNRPSSTIMLDSLTPERLGSLMAMYEHKVFVQAAIWDINPFDQWGVELGKKISREIHQHLVEKKAEHFDSSTLALMQRYWQG